MYILDPGSPGSKSDVQSFPGCELGHNSLPDVTILEGRCVSVLGLPYQSPDRAASTTEVYFLPGLEAGSLKSRCGQVGSL